MPKNYGIPYKGSKSKIAEDIINFLPSGNRFVDLFGGGFAISHCALLSNKWNSVYYNDIDPLLAPLIQKAIDGYYSYDVFKPKFITREEFFEKKDTDGYVKWVWSFGNNGQDYMFGKDVEPIKHAAHDWVVFNKYSDALNDIIPSDLRELKSIAIKDRRLEFCKIVRLAKKRFDFQRLEQLERLERLQRLEQLERLSVILNTHCYTKYEYKEGDVVYCDIPYEGTEGYDKKNAFDHAAFYNWVKTRPFTVYFSSYEISDSDFKCVWQKPRISTMCATNNSLIRIEKLYTNK